MTDQAQSQDTDDLNRKVEALQEQLSKMHGDMAKLVEMVADTVGSPEARLDEAAQAARSKLESEVARAVDAGKKALHEVEETAHRHPVGSLAIAFVVGMVLSRVLGANHKQ